MTRRSLAFDIVIGAAAFVLLALVPLVFPSKALVDFVIRFSAYALFATSLNFLVGYGGMVSFGHGMFFGFGAYAFALLMQRTAMPLPAAFVITLVMCAALALVVGAICVRLKEIYFAFLTLAFQMLLHSLIILWVPLTGGDQGLRGGIPRPPFLGINLANQTHLYLTSCVLLIVGLILMHHLVQSPFGYTLRMIRDNAARANFLGIPVFRVRLMAFTMAGVFGGAGGIIMSLFVSGAYPEFAYWTISGEGIFIIMLGGLNTFLGPALGTAILLLLNDFVTRHTEYYGLTLGIIILVFALGLRRGLLDVLLDLWRRHSAAARAGAKAGNEASAASKAVL
jgi:branched-chain amino acid transport system permease protein